MIRFKRSLCVFLCVAAVFGLLNIMPLKAKAAPMTSSVEMIDVLKQMEGFNAKPFWDYGQYTVGYGTRCPEDKRAYYSTYGITEEEALILLREELNEFEEQVNNFIVKRNLTVDQGQFDALVSISYNCGGAWMNKTNTNLFRAVTSGNKGEDLIYAFTLYSTAGGSYLEGLVKRRLSEANMYINGIYKASNLKDGIPANYKWVFLDGNGATVDGGIFGYDSNLNTKVKATFTEIPTGIDDNGNPFAYKLAGWYTASGKKVEVLDSTLTNGQTLTAKWVDPAGNVLGGSTEESVEVPITVTGSTVNIRKGPGTGYDKNGTAKKGQTYTVTAVATGSGYTWGKIGTDKWICLDYTDYKAPEQKPDQDEPQPEIGFPKTGTVNADDVNVRSGPSTGNSKVYQLDKGDQVTIVEEDRSSNPPWGKLSDGNWIRLDFVDYAGSGIVSVELIQLPEKTSYESIHDMLRLEGSILFVTYADGSSEALTLTSEMIKDYSMTGPKEATVTAQYKGFTVTFTVAVVGIKLTIVKQPSNAYADAGETAKVSLTANGDGLQYLWFAKNKDEEAFHATQQTTAVYTVEMTEELDGCKLYCQITDIGGETMESNVVTLHLGAMAAPIVITAQPVDTYVASGSRASTTVTATGEGLKYQWYYKDKDDKSYSQSSVTGATYACSMNAERDGREVYCEITDIHGNTLTTETVTLNIKRTLSITKQPANVSALVGATASVSVQAAGNDVQYVWYVKQPGGSAFEASDVNAATYTLELSEENNGTQVYCVLSDCHGKSVTSNTVTFSVKEQASVPTIEITKQPQNVVVKIGERAATSVTAKGEGLKYQWYYKDKNQTTWTKSSLTSTTYALTLTAARDGRQAYCQITDKYGNTVKTDTITLSSKAVVTPEPEPEPEPQGKIEITKQPQNVVVKIGERAATSVTAKGEGLKYQWYYKDKSQTTWTKSSLTSTTYALTLTAARDGRQAYCQITDKYGNTVKTDTITLSSKAVVTPEPEPEPEPEPQGKIEITKQPQNVVVKIGERAATSVTAKGEGLKYQWYYKDKNQTTWTKSSLTSTTYALTLTAARDGRQAYCQITDKYGNTVKTDTITLSSKAAVTPEPEPEPQGKIEITKQPQNVVVKIGERAATSVTAKGEGLKYQWYYKDKKDTTWTKSSLTSTTYALTLTAARDGRQAYCQITDKYGNTVKTDTITLSSKAVVTPEPEPEPEPQGKIEITKQPQNVVVKIGERAATSVTAKGEGLKYQWYYKDKNQTTWTKSSLTSTTYALTLTAARDGRQAYCQITDKYGNTVKTDTITLSSKAVVTPEPEPEPQGKIEITKQPQNVVVKIGERAATSVTAKGDGLKYQWYYKDTDDGIWNKSTLTSNTYACTVNASRVGRLIYCVITDKYGNSVQTDTIKFTTVDAIRAENPDYQDAVEQLRAEMVKREAVITVEYLGDSEVTKENDPGTDLLFAALEHTGKPKEGDYLYRHCKSLKYSIESTVHPGGHWVTATYTITYRTTAEQEDEVDKAVARILHELDVSDASDYQKVKAIYDYLCKNVIVDHVGSVLGDTDIYSAHGALVKGNAVCHGFATAFYRLALELDLDVRLIAGKFENSAHGWNIVKINGKYYNVDATRDAGAAPSAYQYFLKSDDSMPKHIRSSEYATAQFYKDYPMATTDYAQ